jgi:hypothetical protein
VRFVKDAQESNHELNQRALRDAPFGRRVPGADGGIGLRLPLPGGVNRSGSAPHDRPPMRANKQGGEANNRPRPSLPLTAGFSAVNQEQTSGKPECHRSSASGAS